MRLLRPHLLTLAAAAIAALPVAAATLDAIAIGWTPLGDRAVIAVRSLDVLSGRPPLLGQFSASSQLLGEAVHSPGPMLYWVLALPVRMATAAPAVAIGLLNVAAIAGIVILARRRGGVALMLAVAAGIPLVLASLEPSMPYDPWNPSAGVMPFTLTLFLAWSLACGEWRLAPVTVLAASFAVQCHLGYVLPIGAALAVAAAFLVRRRPGIPRPWLVATATAVALCWLAPAVQTVANPPGNFVRIVQAAATDKQTFGAAAGLRAAARTAGVPPWWLRTPRDTGARVEEVVAGPAAATWVSAALVVLALAALTALAVRRGRTDAAAAGAIALGVLGAVALTAASAPTEGILFGTIGYSLWWAHPAGLFAHLALVVLVARLWPPRVAAPRPAAVAAGAGAGAAFLVAVAVVAARGEDRLAGAYEPGRELARAVRSGAPPGHVEVRASSSLLGFEFHGAAALALRERGPRPRTSLPMGTPYNPDLGAAATLLVTDGRPPPRGRTLASFVLNGVPSDARPDESRNRRIAVTVRGD